MDDTKPPFPPFDKDEPDAAAQASPNPGSVTGMFGPPVRVERASTSTDDLLAELLRAKAPTAASISAGAPEPALPKPATAAGVGPPPTEAGRNEPGDGGNEPGSVTRMLRDLHRPAGSSSPLSPPPPAAHSLPAAPSISSPSLSPMTPVRAPASEPASPPASGESDPGEFTRIFTQLPTPKPLAMAPAQAERSIPAPATPATRPGEFTQFLQKLTPLDHVASTPAAASAPTWVPPAPLPREAPTAPHAPGSFTQLFQAVSQGKASEKASNPSPRHGAPPPAAATPAAATPAPGAVAPGVVAPGAAPSAGPGTFTQMFQAVSANPVDRPVNQSVSQNASQAGDPSADRSFDVSPEASWRAASLDRPTPVGQRGFTHLFDSLSAAPLPSHASPSPPPGDTPFRMPPPDSPEPLQTGSGEFTRLMRTLSDPPPATPSGQAGGGALPPSSPPSAPAHALNLQSGPGEFTRIISASALREAGVHSGAASPPLAPAQGKLAAFAPVASPLPQFRPQLPPVSPPTPAGFGLPQAFAPPAPPAPAPLAQSKLQQYLPVIVVVNVAVLLIVVMILIFALRHH